MMNKTEASEILGVTRTTIYAMLEDGRLRATRDGKVSTQSVIDLIRDPEINTGRKPLVLRC